MRGRCEVTVYSGSAKLRAKYGPFRYCGRPLVGGFNECRVHLKGRLRVLERDLQAMRAALGEVADGR